MIKYKYLNIIALCAIYLASCDNSFLDVKPDQRQRVPVSIADYQAIMDNSSEFSIHDPINIHSSHTLGIIGGDELYVTEALWGSFPAGKLYNYQKNAYLWKKLIYEGEEGGPQNPTDYDAAYRRILRCNVVLEGLAKIKPNTDELAAWQNVKGTALFHRALNYYNLAQLYCPVFSLEQEDNALGLPLRFESDPTIQIGRSSLKLTYESIISDLREAAELLPDIPLVLFRPSKTAVLALRARVCLQMGNYLNALESVNEALAFKDELIDFNQLEINDNFTFPLYGEGNPEVIFITTAFEAGIYSPTFFNADTTLIKLYDDNDLRLDAYFRWSEDGQTTFYGSYYGSRLFFTGLATDECYLIKAECEARLNKPGEALATLNLFRRHRIESLTYTQLISTDVLEILDWVIAERRKELVLRGTRWEDIRRLNKEERYAVTLKRKVGLETAVLPPTDKRFTWPIPPDAVLLGHLENNER